MHPFGVGEEIWLALAAEDDAAALCVIAAESSRGNDAKVNVPKAFAELFGDCIC